MLERLQAYILTYQRRNTKVGQHHDTKHNPVISEKLEIMLADISHQELDRVHGHAKCDHHTKNQINELRERKSAALNEKFHNL